MPISSLSTYFKILIIHFAYLVCLCVCVNFKVCKLKLTKKRRIAILNLLSNFVIRKKLDMKLMKLFPNLCLSLSLSLSLSLRSFHALLFC